MFHLDDFLPEELINMNRLLELGDQSSSSQWLCKTRKIIQPLYVSNPIIKIKKKIYLVGFFKGQEWSERGQWEKGGGQL